MGFLVGTERLGLPSKPNWRERHGWTLRLQNDVEPQTPTATCHLLAAAEEPALCGYQWEGLVTVPGSPAWTDIDAGWRCSECDALRPIEPG